jgi:hypothetical protein
VVLVILQRIYGLDSQTSKTFQYIWGGVDGQLV